MLWLLAHPSALSDHLPGSGRSTARWSQTVLRGRARRADIDQGDAAPVGRHHVVGRHLVTPPRALGDHAGRIHGVVCDGEPRGRQR